MAVGDSLFFVELGEVQESTVMQARLWVSWNRGIRYRTTALSVCHYERVRPLWVGGAANSGAIAQVVMCNDLARVAPGDVQRSRRWVRCAFLPVEEVGRRQEEELAAREDSTSSDWERSW